MVPGGMVAPSDVIVHGPGGIEAVLKTLRDIAETRESAGNSAQPPEASAASRQFKDVNEFKALQQRVKSRDATVRLRKVFVCQGECNVMQEIWIEDKKNPAAQGNPLKSYAIVHAHHHALAGDKEGITVEDLDVVDAINVRHLAPAGKGCQKDNPFFNTFIEPSSPSTLKVFPPEKEWTCDVCGQKNAHSTAGLAVSKMQGTSLGQQNGLFSLQISQRKGWQALWWKASVSRMELEAGAASRQRPGGYSRKCGCCAAVDLRLRKVNESSCGCSV